jgi:hypothetical protein
MNISYSSPKRTPEDKYSFLFVYKNMAGNRLSGSHVGLGVTAMNSAKVLMDAGVKVRVVGVFDGYELRDKVLPGSTYTHVVMFAPWVDTPFLQALVRKYPHIAFAITFHSNVGFLQADRYAVQLLREQMELEMSNHNFHLAANSTRLVNAVKNGFHRPAVWLPNLYYIQSVPAPPSIYRHGDTLKIGIFGAMRPQKNMLTAAWAALQIARTLNVRCEVSINSGRIEGGQSTLGAIRELLNGLLDVKLIEAGWMTWPQFRSYVKSQHLLLSPSYTESFCNVTADGIAEGVPSVVSDAIHWVPNNWKASFDDTGSIANVGIKLLNDKNSASNGMKSLKAYNQQGITQWKQYAGSSII